MKILITGSNGIIGRQMLNELIINYPGSDIYTVNRTISNNDQAAGVQSVELDILNADESTIVSLFEKIKPSLFFHLAWNTDHKDYLTSVKNKLWEEVTINLIDAFYESGEGFCILNDISVAANYLLYKGLRNRILIIDLDVHQGNGTASIFSKEERIFTFSMHGQNNYPLRKENSDLDIGLPDGIDDTRYLSLLAYQIPKIFKDFEPDFVFYQAGVDILETDRLGRLKITRNGCLERDNLVLKNCYSNKVPVVVVMGGGYSTLLTDIVEAHCNTFRTALNLFF